MNLSDALNEQQKQAVLHTEGQVLILAGAGSGKTRVLTHRIAYLMEELQVKPWSIMAITFTNKAAKEMRERVDALVGSGAEDVHISTFHSFCVRVLRRHIEHIGYDRNFSIYDADDTKTVMRDICKRMNIDTKQLKERTILGKISSAKDELISPEEYMNRALQDFTLKRIAQVYLEYQDTLRKNNALDFDDLIMKTVELFRHCPEVLEGYRNRFTYLMVDEYQDTNTAQFQLVHLLAGENGNLCVVGDDDQSIYKFRGANIRNILDFEHYYPQAKVIKLEQNYRSTQNVLDAANSVISNNQNRKSKKLWTAGEEGEKIHFRRLDTAYEEADYIAGDIARKCRLSGCGYGEFAVLYRTNAQSRLLEERMIMEGLPYEVVGGINFYSRKEIKDVLAYLKTIDNGRDDVAVKRIINVPKRGIGQATIQKVQDYADENNISLFDAMVVSQEMPFLGKSAVKLEPFIRMIQVFRSKLEYYGLKELIEDVLETTGYRQALQDSEEEDAEDRLENIEELVNKVTAYVEDYPEADLSAFLEEVALVAEIDKVGEQGKRVLLMTLHSAKGLEFEYVYLAGLEDGLFPSYQTIASESADDLEEERRLAYVGITRAKKELTLTCAGQRMIHGETQYNVVSRFVKEIPEELLEGEVPRPRSRFSENSVKFTSFDRPEREKKKPIPPYQIQGLSKGMPVTAGAVPDYKVGDRVSHQKFGEGLVLELEKGPRDYQVKVRFDNGEDRVMYAAFAKLKRI